MTIVIARARVVALVFLLVLAACGGDEAPAPIETGIVVTAEDVTFGGLLGQIRGHHRVAVELYRSGDKASASIHTGHPLAEILAVIKPRILRNEPPAAAALEQALSVAAKVVADGRPASRLQTAVAGAAAAVDRAENAVIGSVRGSVAYRASIVGSLLLTSAAEYAVALGGGAVRNLVEFQDAYGFRREAEQIYAGISRQVGRVGPEKAAGIRKALDVLEAALPGTKPPPTLVAIGEVTRAATTAGDLLEETVNAFAVAYLAPEKAFENIETLLTDLVRAYRAGDRDEAASLAAKAYLENYELVEAQVITLAPDVNRELEPLMSDELLSRIQDGIPVDQLEALVARVRVLTAKAREAVLKSS